MRYSTAAYAGPRKGARSGQLSWLSRLENLPLTRYFFLIFIPLSPSNSQPFSVVAGFWTCRAPLTHKGSRVSARRDCSSPLTSRKLPSGTVRVANQALQIPDNGAKDGESAYIVAMVWQPTLSCSGPARNKTQPSPLPLCRAGLIEPSLIPTPRRRLHGNARSHEAMDEGPGKCFKISTRNARNLVHEFNSWGASGVRQWRPLCGPASQRPTSRGRSKLCLFAWKNSNSSPQNPPIPLKLHRSTRKRFTRHE
jgi:hypothetical protein